MRALDEDTRVFFFSTGPFTIHGKIREQVMAYIATLSNA